VEDTRSLQQARVRVAFLKPGKNVPWLYVFDRNAGMV
jgi:hypothetical protein